MKVIKNIELLKKLIPLLEDRETDYVLCDRWYMYKSHCVKMVDTEDKNSAMYWKGKPYWYIKDVVWHKCYWRIYKTLTTDEMFEFMWKAICHFNMPYPNAWELNWWTLIWSTVINAKDLNEYFQKCIEYLIDNDLLN